MVGGGVIAATVVGVMPLSPAPGEIAGCHVGVDVGAKASQSASSSPVWSLSSRIQQILRLFLTEAGDDVGRGSV